MKLKPISSQVILGGGLADERGSHAAPTSSQRAAGHKLALLTRMPGLPEVSPSHLLSLGGWREGAGEGPFPPRGQQVSPWAMPQGQTVAALSIFFPVLSIHDLVQGKAISSEKKGTCRKNQ